MKQFSEIRRFLQNLRRDQRGAILMITTVYMPVIVGFFTLAVDMSYVYRSSTMLQSVADAAALAAIDDGLEIGLPLNAANACSIAKTYATKNIDPATSVYGNVLKQNTGVCSDVVLGTWSCPAGQLCTVAANFSSAACGSTCNAVMVTTRMSSANGNPLVLNFASMIGWPNINLSATAVATYGNDPGALPLNVGLVQDVSGSFAQEINNAKAADQALANCMLNAATGSKLGISVFGVTSNSYQTPLTVNGNSSTLTTAINGISVGGRNMPSENGTDIAAGINSAISQICPGSTCTPPPTGFKPAIVLLTDGLPNTCNGQSCSVSTAQANAATAAQNAANMGMDVYAIYFCNDGTGTCNSQTNIAAADWLVTLVKGNGKFMKTPTASQFSTLMSSGVCKPSLRIRLVF